jgi:HPt (histidine-containing phosphotransfer) domain-containing protein/CheY-like chemotaxis protein
MVTEHGVATQTRTAAATATATLKKSQRDLVLVDDDLTFCHTMVYAAKRRGLEIDYFTNLMDMGSIACFQKYSVAIVDFQLEQMNGLEVAEYFPVFFDDMPVILISQNEQGDGSQRQKWPQSIKQFVHKKAGAEAILDAALNWRRNPNLIETPGIDSMPLTRGYLDPSITNALNELDQGTDGFLYNLYRIFLSSSEKTIADMHTALAALDFKELAGRAHKLKGSAHNIGALILGEEAARLEVHARHNNIAAVYQLIREIDQEWAAVRDSIRKLMDLCVV